MYRPYVEPPEPSLVGGLDAQLAVEPDDPDKLRVECAKHRLPWVPERLANKGDGTRSIIRWRRAKGER
jgi:hypothetical protein